MTEQQWRRLGLLVSLALLVGWVWAALFLVHALARSPRPVTGPLLDALADAYDRAWYWQPTYYVLAP